MFGMNTLLFPTRRIVVSFIVPTILMLVSCGGGDSGSSTPSLVMNTVQDPAQPNTNTTNGNPRIALERIFTGLTFDAPLLMLQAPADTTRWFVLERAGRVRVFANNSGVSTFNTDFIDLRSRVDTAGEGGLLGMAFHPNFSSNGHVFLHWTQTGAPMVSFVSRFTTIAGGTALDPASEVVILRMNHPFTNHKGGHIAFGPDGHLYVGVGDGGGSGDPNGNAQDTTDMLGSILRIDVNSGSPYSIPADNPFAGNPNCTADPNVSAGNCPEIYAWGFRNPWRWSFDMLTGTLWVADVGQNAWEEVDQVTRGGNYGWNSREGAHCFNPPTGCSTAGLIEPVAEYGHSLGNSITGGYVYRGTSVNGLGGTYVFGDFGTGRIWRLVSSGGAFTMSELLDTTLSIASFSQDNNGEIYVVDIAGDALYRIING